MAQEAANEALGPGDPESGIPMGLSFPSYITGEPSMAGFLSHTPSAASRVLSEEEDTVQEGILIQALKLKASTPCPVIPGIKEATKDPLATSQDSKTNLQRLPLARDGPSAASVRVITAMDQDTSDRFPSTRPQRYSQQQIISHSWRIAGNQLIFLLKLEN